MAELKNNKVKDKPRQLALDILLRFEKAGNQRLKADSLLQDGLLRSGETLSDQDRGFVRALVLGTLRHWLCYDEWIKSLTGRPLKNLTPLVRCILRLGFFQLQGLSHVPAYAALNSTVELAKQQKQSPKTVKFINAVLREAQRRIEGEGFFIPTPEADLSAYLLWTAGWPGIWTERLVKVYSSQEILEMAEAAQVPAALSIRVNTLKQSLSAYQEALETAEIAYQAFANLPEGLLLPEFSGSPRLLPGYAEGHVYIQDAASMWVTHLLNPLPGERVLDLCAAPGSKTTHMAALMNNMGFILALDPKPERLQLLTDNLQRLNVKIVETQATDALKLNPAANEPFDKVLVDAPCSGSGTIRRHPEILPQWKKTDLSAYNHLQLALLHKGFESLKPGGSLVYSTCSIMPAENTELVGKFLTEAPQAQLESEEQRLIQKQADGFYAARLIKKPLESV